MDNIKLHVCLTGFHPDKNFNNIKSLFDRMKDKKSNIDLEFHIVFKTNERNDLKDYVLGSDIKNNIKDVNFFDYESDYLKSGGIHKPHTPSSLTIQHEPLREFLFQDSIIDNDFILKTRTDIHIDDHFLDMFLDDNFYKSLKTSKSPYTIFEYKIWNSLIGPGNVFEFTDYFFLSRAKELKSVLVKSHQESEYLWSHPISSCDNVPFAEKLQFIKPILPLIEKFNITGVGSKFYWDIINNNFLISYIGEGNDPRRPVLDRNVKY